MRSPELDFLLRSAQRNQRFTTTAADKTFAALLHSSHRLLNRIKPSIDGSDRRWSIWLRTDRGAIADFGDYEEYLAEGEVESRAKFDSLWQMEYPDTVQWWRLNIIQNREELWFFLGKGFHFSADLCTGAFGRIDPSDKYGQRLITWLLKAVSHEVLCFTADCAGYNRGIEHNLPKTKRYGRFRRSDLWAALKGVNPEKMEFAAVDIDHFRRLVQDPGKQTTNPEMSLSSFLDYCRICYEANSYPQLQSSMTPMDMYRAMADGRDEGMLDLPPDDSSAFGQWHRDRGGGGHPFEICRGGNSTHISLSPIELKTGWRLLLAGFSRGRIVETAKMALALRQAGANFELRHKKEMLRMLTAEDFVGIVPDDISIGYNQSEFPAEDRIHGFAPLWAIIEACGSIPGSMHWYPLVELELNPDT